MKEYIDKIEKELKAKSLNSSSKYDKNPATITLDDAMDVIASNLSAIVIEAFKKGKESKN
jgi:hypothetical protein